MMRALTAITAFVALAGATLPAFADCAGHSQTVETTTTPQTVVQSGTTPMTPVPPVTPKTGG
jgi:hypothetical protein